MLHSPLVVWRSGSAPAQLPFVTSVVTRSRPSSSSASSPSNVSSMKLHRTWRSVSSYMFNWAGGGEGLSWRHACTDGSALPIVCRDGPPGGLRGIPRFALWRCQFGHCPCQTRDDPTQGPCPCTEAAWRAFLLGAYFLIHRFTVLY